MSEEVKIGLNYPIWVEGPKKIDITTREFYSLSYMGLASFWCHWKVVFHKTKDGGMKLYTHRCNIVEVCYKNKRFEGIQWYENSSTEMYFCTIPNGHKLIPVIEKKFCHLIMEGEED